MTRYFFDTHDGEQEMPDEIGIDLPTREDVESTVRVLLSVALDRLTFQINE